MKLKIGDIVEIFQEDDKTPIIPSIIRTITDVEDVNNESLNIEYQCIWVGEDYGFFFDYQVRKL